MKGNFWHKYFRKGYNAQGTRAANFNGWCAKTDAKTTRTRLNRKLDALDDLNLQITNTAMARFKENDLITNGNVTLWITGVTEREYEFTDHDMNKFFLPIEGIDRNYCLYESKSIWHKADEPIENDKEVLIEYKTGSHDVACYVEDEDMFCAGGCFPKRKDITRWAYIKDLVNF